MAVRALQMAFLKWKRGNAAMWSVRPHAVDAFTRANSSTGTSGGASRVSSPRKRYMGACKKALQEMKCNQLWAHNTTQPPLDSVPSAVTQGR